MCNNVGFEVDAGLRNVMKTEGWCSEGGSERLDVGRPLQSPEATHGHGAGVEINRVAMWIDSSGAGAAGGGECRLGYMGVCECVDGCGSWRRGRG